MGLRINTLRYNFSDSAYTDNRFEDNGTGIIIEQLGGDWVLDFSGCVFAGNGTDIDNRAGYQLDLSHAAFE